MSTKSKRKSSKESNNERKFIEAEEDALSEFQYLLFDLMEDRNISKADLAERLGISRARMSQLFSSAANPTLKTAARCIAAAGSRLRLQETREQTSANSTKTDSTKTTATVRIIVNACITDDWSGSKSANGQNENFAPKGQVA